MSGGESESDGAREIAPVSLSLLALRWESMHNSQGKMAISVPMYTPRQSGHSLGL